MTVPAVALLVKFKTRLSLEEVQHVVESRIEDFRALSALKQKYYLRDTKTGEYAGLYLWESREGLAEYRASELSKTIAKAYETEGDPRIEVYDVLLPLRDTGD